MGKNIFPTLSTVTEKMQNSTWPSVGQNFQGENAAYEAYALTGLFAYDGPNYNQKKLASFWDVGTTMTFTPDDTYVAIGFAHDWMHSQQRSAYIVYKRDLLGNYNNWKIWVALYNNSYTHKILFSDKGKYLFLASPQYNADMGILYFGQERAFDSYAFGGLQSKRGDSYFSNHQNRRMGRFLEKLPFDGVITSLQFFYADGSLTQEQPIIRSNYTGYPKDIITWWQDNHQPNNPNLYGPPYQDHSALLPQETSLLSLATFSINDDGYFVTSHADSITIYRIEDFWSYCDIAYGSRPGTDDDYDLVVMVGNHSQYIPSVNNAYFGARIAAAYSGTALAFVSYNEIVSAAMLTNSSQDQYLGEVSVVFSYTQDGLFDFNQPIVLQHPFQGLPSQPGVNRWQYANFGNHERFGIMFSDDGEVLIITDDINIYIYAVVYASRSIILRKTIKHKGIDYLQNVYLHPSLNDLYVTESADPIGGRTFFEDTYSMGNRWEQPNNTLTIYPAKG